MKIAQVYPHCSIRVPGPLPGDALGLVNYELARRLARHHEVITYPRWSPGEPLEEQAEGVTWHRVPQHIDRALNALKTLDGVLFPRQRPFRLSRWYYAHYGAHVAGDIDRRGCDLVHVHSVSNFLPALHRRAPHRPLVLHVHDHLLADFDPAPTARRLALASAVLGCSNFVIEALRARHPQLAARFHTLHNGVDARFLEVASDPARSQRVLFVGRLCPEKGVHVLAEAAALLQAGEAAQHGTREADAGMPADWSMDVVGPLELSPRQFVDPFGRDPRLVPLAGYYAHPGRYAQLLEARARELGPRFTLHGPVPNDRITERYAQAGIFVFPSVWHEPFGIPAIEAMAAGLPVIATRAGALPEIVVDGETGILVERGDAAGLAAALRRLVASPELRARMGAAGRERVRRLFTWDRAVARLEEIYGQLVTAARRSPSDAGRTAAASGR